MSKHLEKMCLETKLQPFRLRNDRDIDRSTWPAYDCRSTVKTGVAYCLKFGWTTTASLNIFDYEATEVPFHVCAQEQNFR